MRGLCLLCGALFALASGCGEESLSPPAPGEAGGEEWEAIAETMPDGADLASPNPCGNGSRECIEAVVGEMQRRLDALAAACDHNAPFALMYLRVTEGVGQNTGGVFEDPAYLNHLDAVFAELYFQAFDTWRSGTEQEVPEAWRIAFEAADERELNALGDMLLGMNAHISRDLPFALERTGLVGTRGQDAEADFNAVNSLLADVQEPMIIEQSERFDPGVAEATLPALEIDGSSIGDLISQWRTEAWENAERLTAAEGEEHEDVAGAIEESAAGRARLIEALTSNLVVGPGAEVRERFCGERDGGV